MSPTNQAITTDASPSSRAAKGATLLFVSQFAGYAFFFLSQRAILSSLSKDEYGVLAFIQQTCSLVLVVLADSGLNNITIREAVQNPHKHVEILRASLWLRFLGSVLSCIIVATFFVFTDASLVTTSLIAVMTVVLSGRTAMLRSSLEMPMRVRTDFKPIAMMFVVDAALYAVLLLAYPGTLSARLVLELQLVATLPSLLYLGVRTRVFGYVSNLPDVSTVKTLLRTTRPVVFQLLLQNVHAGIDVFALRFLTSLRELAVFGAVANMSMVVITMYTALSTAIYPLLAEASHGDEEVLRSRILRSLSMVTFVCIMAAALLSVAAPLIVIVFTKNAYAHSVRAFQLQFWCSVAIVISQFTLVINTAMKQHRAVVVSGFMLVAGSLMFDFVLIPRYGTDGMLVAKTLSNLLSAGASLWYVREKLGGNVIAAYLRRVFIVGTVTCTISLLSPQVLPMYPALILVMAAGSVLGWWTDMITRTDVVQLLHALPITALRSRLQRSAQD